MAEFESLLPQQAAAAEPRHFNFVDSLRGFAILGVMMIHASIPLPGLTLRLLKFAEAGKYGVQLFFVVSAFTLFSSLGTRTSSDRKPLHAFYVRRIFRIGPLFWIATAFYAMVPSDRSYWAPNGIGPWHILTTLTFLHGWYPTTINSVVPGGWSIADEFMFYLSIPILFRYIRSVDAAAFLTMASIFIVSAGTPVATHRLMHRFPAAWKDLVENFIYLSFPSQFPVFCLGLLLYQLIGRGNLRGEKSPAAGMSPSCLIAVALFLILVEIPVHVIYAIAFVIFASALARLPFKLLVNPVTRFIGTVSFSAYIWHFWLLDHIAPILLRLLGLHGLPHQIRFAVQFLVLYAVLVVVTLPVAWVSYRIIEVPGQRAGKGLINILRWGRGPLLQSASES